MRVNPFVIPIVALVALLGTVMAAQGAGLWATNGRAGTDLTRLAPADLKGWMTLQDVMNGLKISKEELYAAANIPADTAITTPLNKLEAIVPGFSVTALRTILAAKLGAGGAASSGPELPKEGQPEATPLTGQTLTKPTEPENGATPRPAGQTLPADQIKGRMSLTEVSEQCGVPMDRLLAGLKLDSNTDPKSLIKDLVAAGKLTEVTQVQQVVGQLQRP